MRMDPADSIITKMGGATHVARITGCSFAWVCKWAYPKERSGTGGTVPIAAARKLLEHATRSGIDLTPDEFLAEPTPAASRKRRAA